MTVTSGKATSAVDMELVGDGEFTTAPTPTIAGNLVVGATIEAKPGTWTPTPSSFSYQWFRNGKGIAGATRASYAVAPDDLGALLTVTATSHLAGYATVARTSVASAAVKAGALVGALPTIAGTAALGSTLTAVPGAWEPAPVSRAYQWNRDGKPIAAATAVTHVVAAADAGAKLSVTVTGTKRGYTTASRTSAETVRVTALSFATAPVPAISGTAKVGSVLTTKPGTTWAPVPASFGYAWKRGGVAIVGATSANYRLSSADVGRTITVTVTATKLGYASVAKTSKATGKVAVGSLTARTPTIRGMAQVGQTLTAEPGAWVPTEIGFRYQWYRSKKKISGASAVSYVLAAKDLRKKITVKVTGSSVGYTAAAKTSKATRKVTAGALTVGKPTIKGTAQAGVSLTAATGTWGSGTVAYRYQWYRAGSAIKGAKKAVFTPRGADVGKVLTVKVSGTKSGYATKSVASVSTRAVGAGVHVPGKPTISGTAVVGHKLTGKPGTWGPGKVTLRYQWTRNGSAIAKATARTYTLTSADRGNAIVCVVTGSETGFTTATARSGGVTVTP